MLKNSSRSKTVVPWSSEDLVMVGCLHSVHTVRTTLGRERERLYESSRGRTRQGAPRTTCLKTVADDFFGTRPSEDWGDRAISPLPRRYRVVLDSARRFPTIFALFCDRSTKNRIGYYRDQNNPSWNGDITDVIVRLAVSQCGTLICQRTHVTCNKSAKLSVGRMTVWRWELTEDNSSFYKHIIWRDLIGCTSVTDEKRLV